MMEAVGAQTATVRDGAENLAQLVRVEAAEFRDDEEPVLSNQDVIELEFTASSVGVLPQHQVPMDAALVSIGRLVVTRRSGVRWMLPPIFSSNRMSFIGRTQYGLNPTANSPDVAGPASESNTVFSASVSELDSLYRFGAVPKDETDVVVSNTTIDGWAIKRIVPCELFRDGRGEHFAIRYVDPSVRRIPLECCGY